MRSLRLVLLFWSGYLAITLVVGFATSKTIESEVWQLAAWGFISSAGLIALSRAVFRDETGTRGSLDWLPSPSSLGRLAIGLLVGVASYGVHVLIVSTVAGPIRFEWVPQVGATVAAILFVRFLATSCMEEIGFRGDALRRLADRFGLWPAVGITAVAFGLSHLSYGWSLQTIALGVIPGGVLWGMSAIATRGIAVPIGLHAAWNFAGWTAGARSETGLLTMTIEDDAVARTQAAGTVSYLCVFGTLTVAFWLVQRRNLTGQQPPPA